MNSDNRTNPDSTEGKPIVFPERYWDIIAIPFDSITPGRPGEGWEPFGSLLMKPRTIKGIDRSTDPIPHIFLGKVI